MTNITKNLCFYIHCTVYIYIYISLRNITLFTHTYSISKIHNLFHLCPAWVIINRIEGSLIDSVYRNAFLEFSVTLKKDSERSGLDWTELDRTTSDFYVLNYFY